jgi:hypothetical protein
MRIPASALIVGSLLLGGCAIPVRQLPVASPIMLASGPTFVLAQEEHVSIGTGYGRTLRAGTHWTLFGTIDRGDVYRSADQVLTVEGYNVHEAYLVVRDDTLVGFYLPVEKTFTPISKNVKLAVTSQ